MFFLFFFFKFKIHAITRALFGRTHKDCSPATTDFYEILNDYFFGNFFLKID
jgi:hypothetical protein